MADVVDVSGLEGPSKPGTYDELLAGPTSREAGEAPPTLARDTASYTCQDARFELKKKEYERQYAQLYFYRLSQMRADVEAAARSAWPDIPVSRISKLTEDEVEAEVAVVGTVYKEMALKPSILDEYVKDRALAQSLGRTRFTAPEDRLVLEDESARVALCGDALPAGACVTGVVAAVRGRVLPSGDFHVTAVTYAGMAPQPPLPADRPDSYVALVSGLGVGDEEGDPLRLQLLVDYLAGALGAGQDQSVAARVARVVVAGGLLKSTAELSQPTAYTSLRQQASALGPVRDLDMSLTELASAVPLDLMPGAGDPSNYSLPQQPLHRCLLPGAAAYASVVRATNPHAFTVAGVSFLGTSGQNVDDIHRYSDLDSRDLILERLLAWRHLAPTAPDTLAAYPYFDADPFIMDATPHVLFAGGQPEFGTRLVAGPGGAGPGVRVVAVPDFNATGCLVLLNLATLQCHPLYFDVGAAA